MRLPLAVLKVGVAGGLECWTMAPSASFSRRQAKQGCNPVAGEVTGHNVVVVPGSDNARCVSSVSDRGRRRLRGRQSLY